MRQANSVGMEDTIRSGDTDSVVAGILNSTWTH